MVVRIGTTRKFFRIGSLTPFTPLSIANLELWCDATRETYSDTSFTTPSVAAGLVQGWKDISGNNRHFTQANGSLSGTWQTGILNGLPVVRFDSNDEMTGTWTGYGGGSCTVFSIWNPSRAAEATLLGSAATGLQIRSDATSGNLTILKTSTANIGTSSTGSASGFYFGIWRYNRTTGASSFRIANASAGTATSAITDTTSNVPILGRQGAGSNEYLNGDLAEFGVYSTVLSDADCDALYAYALSKWLTVTSDSGNAFGLWGWLIPRTYYEY